MSVTLERHANTLVAAKRLADEQRLSHESDVLARMQHPGIIEHIDFVDGESAVLLTAWAGTDTWDRRTPTTASEAIAALAALASTLRDLHEAGVSHRGLSPEHVIIANDGRPILCSLGSAGPADTAGLTTDLMGIRGLAKHLAAKMPDEEAEKLNDLVCRLGEAGASLADVTKIAAAANPEFEPSTIGSAPRRTTIVTSIGAALVATLAALLIFGFPHDDLPTPSAFVEPSIADVNTAELPGSAISTTTSSTTEPPRATATTLPSTIDGAEPTSEVNLVVFDGRRYSLGSPGDVVVIGDWNCNGDPTPAILQVATGRVAVFDGWPGPGRSLLPSLASEPGDADSLMADHVGDCDVLRAVGPYGSTIITGDTS